MPEQNGTRNRTNRRGFLESIGTTSVAGGLAAVLAQRDIVQPVAAASATDPSVFAVDETADPDATFPQSVASGGPTSSGAILWTRIAPSAVVSEEPIGVQVATDDSFEEPVYEGTVPADRLSSTHDYTVKVDLDGVLESDRRYYYRFVYDGVATRTGRCRTLPAAGASPDSLSFAVLTCQDYQNGYYGAYRHLAAEDVDFVVHLGDFIYESADGAYTSPTTDIKDGRDIDLPSGAGLAESLADFRTLYRTYKGNEFLQEGLEQHTVVHGWDDHEIGNNRYWDEEANAPVLPDTDGGEQPERAMEITADGIQAWVEYVPARVEFDPNESALQDQLRLWRDLQFGDLVDLTVTDERLYRDGPPCGDARITCTDEEAQGRTMLGHEQKQYFTEWVSESDAVWSVWANEVLTMPLTIGDNWSQIELLHDSWDGFQHERWELMQHVADVDPRNFVVLTGDLHASLAGHVKAGYGEIEPFETYDRIGVELMTPAVTSVNAADVVDFPSDWDDDALAELTKDQNDHLEYVDWHQHGYAVVEFTRDHCTYTVYGVDKDADPRDAEQSTLARYRTPDGDPSLTEL
ncbi:alkaline phosphatase D family protein [Natrinema thermotolerans]|uniref:Alkaline phosphatase D family protein n=1 Tax=Natrinema thermotolerans TaxID=121872 RepID=A0AAF0PE79_9EURY|nr:alkaline phosphatase D family protein [Natrinema thermotolerans]QCC60527.1 alkaline phosphatase [Natrinema thermotolerans]QCC61423.1 alkaline phosphatase [Natrinema thermotolerans]WMT07565.1 alkaline phosphatase D family protein [Natrinema thermotolerans]WMT08197.1 alkaline phosphatase D family protein [Natrinema thermotolerans]